MNWRDMNARASAQPTPEGEPEPTRSSFDQVYEEHFDFVWANLRRMGVRPSQLEDAAQDVFIVVHRQLGGFEGRSSVRTWIAGVAWRVASEYRRHESRKGAEPLPEELPAPGPDPHRAAVHAEAVRLLDELLQRLDHDKRAVFVLADIEGLTVPDIAGALGVNLNTVYARLRAARKIFERALQQRNGSGR